VCSLIQSELRYSGGRWSIAGDKSKGPKYAAHGTQLGLCRAVLAMVASQALDRSHRRRSTAFIRIQRPAEDTANRTCAKSDEAGHEALAEPLV